MNTYLVKTPAATFKVVASGSNAACWEANSEAARVRLYNPSKKAELMLCLGGECLQNLGTFDLPGYTIPTTWAAMRRLKSDLFAEAKAMARDGWALPVIRSRGAVLVVTDSGGTPLITSGDGYAFPTSLTAFRNTLAHINARYPNAHQMFICLGCDSAATVAAMHHGEIQPWTGEAEALIYQF